MKTIFIKELVNGTNVTMSTVKVKFMFFDIFINDVVKGSVVNTSNCKNIMNAVYKFLRGPDEHVTGKGM
jgi:hypothetical protein